MPKKQGRWTIRSKGQVKAGDLFLWKVPRTQTPNPPTSVAVWLMIEPESFLRIVVYDVGDGAKFEMGATTVKTGNDAPDYDLWVWEWE